MPFFGVCCKQTLQSRYKDMQMSVERVKVQLFRRRVHYTKGYSSDVQAPAHNLESDTLRCILFGAASPSARILTHRSHTFAGCFFFCEFLCRLSAEYIRADK